MSSPLKQNTITIQELLNTINSLPEASNGVELPELTNEGTASDLLSGKQLIDQDGNAITGTMTNNGTVSKTLNTSTTSYTIPQGYHSGSGEVSITTETKSVTPTKSTQTVIPTSGKVLSSVTVGAIPSQYITTTDANAVAADIRNGKTSYVNGAKVTGSIQDFDGSYECSGESTGGGSSGGASVETCTVTIVNDTVGDQYIDGDILGIMATVLDNNEITKPFYADLESGSLVISNVVCGTTLYVISFRSITSDLTTSDQNSLIELFIAYQQSYIIWALQPNGDCTITAVG